MTENETTTIRIYSDTKEQIKKYQLRANDSYDDALQRIFREIGEQ